MGKLTEILNLAHERGVALERPYQGELTPREACDLLHLAPGAKIVDVRTRAEWDWVGRVPNAIEIEWNQYPGGVRNPNFLAELKRQVDPEALVMFLCRSGVRSIGAAAAGAAAGDHNWYNAPPGLLGGKGGQGQRGNNGGGGEAGLPWIQG